MGGAVWAGLKLVASEPLLRWLALLCVLGVGVGTLLYNEQAAIVRQFYPDPKAATAYYASIDLAVNGVTLLVQLFVTRALLSRFGIAPALLIPGFAIVLGYAALAASPLPLLVAVVQVMGARPLALFRLVVLPSALPFIMTALRITIPAALIGAIIGEFISSNRGVGYLINAASSRYATAEVFAGILSLLILVLLMNAALSFLERAWFRWAPRNPAALG